MSGEGAGLDIAVIGVSCRFPGADGPEEFWRNIVDGAESLTVLDAAELAAAGEHPEFLAAPNYVPVAVCMGDEDLFDAAFFGLTPREAQEMDPQHRIFLEHSWRALESAGYDPRDTGCPVGVYAGEGINSYVQQVRAAADAQALRRRGLRVEGAGGIGNDLDFLTTRVSYELNLTGPSIPIATACSSSLVAVHLACQALRTFECDMALAGGIAVTPPTRRGYLYAEGGILSVDGHTRPFDARSSGTVLGSGVGVVVLKRLEDALRDRDDVIGVIRGTAINNDGAARAGFTAPGIEGQAEVVSLAQAVAEVDPETIGYLEAHGTATRIGDPIEIEALTRAFRERTDRPGFCALGSVKANIGHMDAAAGVAGLIKALYAARHGVIPPQINFETPNPGIRLAESPFRIVTREEPWRTAPGVPRRAAVSSFGFGGTNAHVVVEEPPAADAPAKADGAETLSASSGASSQPYVIPVAALDETAAREAVSALADRLESASPDLADVAYTLQRGRSRFPVRAAVVARTRDEAVRKLRTRAAGAMRTSRSGLSPAFLFPGQGAQYRGMAAGLYRDLPVFATEFDKVAAAFGFDLHAAVRDGDLDQTRLSQPALFAVEYALAQTLTSAGVTPGALLGHSIGELVAATVAGVWELHDAVRVVDARSRLMQDAPVGAMVSVRAPVDEVRSALVPGAEIAAVNAPDNTAVSGTVEAVDAVTAVLIARGVSVRQMPVSHAYHSALMDDAAAEFARFMRDVPAKAPEIPYASNVTGTWITADEVRDPEYWGRHLRQAVRFADGLVTLAERGDGPWLQVGPGRTALAFARSVAPDSARSLISVLDGPHVPERDDILTLTSALAAVWEAGIEPAFDEWPGADGRRVPLPTYPFQRQRHWVDAVHLSSEPVIAARPDNRDPDRWLSMPTWHETPPAKLDQASVPAPPLVVVAAAGPLADALSPAQIVDPTALESWDAPESRHTIVFVASETTHDVQRLLTLVLRLSTAACRHDLVVVTDGAFDVLGSEDLHPEQALLVGLCKVIPKELARVSCRVLDVDLAAGSRAVAAGIVAEIAVGHPAAVVCHRGARRWVPRIVPLTVAEPALADAGLRYRGVYLITGGFGGIGRSLAEYLARRCRAKLVLIGRTERSEVVQRLRDAGAEVLPLCADVGDKASISNAVDKARKTFGRIDGVIHAAGEIGDGLLKELTADQLAATLRPKVAGTWNLWRALGSLPLDFFALFSSLSTVDAWDGTGAYTAANAYLDAFAHWARRQGRTDVVAIDWTGWWQVGMNATPGASPDDPTRHQYLSEDEGRAAFLRALAAGLPQVHVSVTDPAEVAARGERISLRTAEAPRTTAVRKVSAPRTNAYEAPQSPHEAFLCEAFGEVLGYAEIGRGDNFFTLGGDSLQALDVLARVRDGCGADVLLQEFFSDPTPRGLAGRLGDDKETPE